MLTSRREGPVRRVRAGSLAYCYIICIFILIKFALCRIETSTSFAENRSYSKRHPGDTVPQANVDPRIIQIPVIDGNGIKFTRLSKEDGLSQTKVTQSVQDNLGLMWFLTQYGLNRHDGYKFKVFKHKPGQPNIPEQAKRWQRNSSHHSGVSCLPRRSTIVLANEVHS